MRNYGLDENGTARIIGTELLEMLMEHEERCPRATGQQRWRMKKDVLLPVRTDRERDRL